MKNSVVMILIVSISHLLLVNMIEDIAGQKKQEHASPSKKQEKSSSEHFQNVIEEQIHADELRRFVMNDNPSNDIIEQPLSQSDHDVVPYLTSSTFGSNFSSVDFTS